MALKAPPNTRRFLLMLDTPDPGVFHHGIYTLSCCPVFGVHLSRYVDDLTISGNFDIQQSGVPKLIARILIQHGLSANQKKNDFGELRGGIAITGIRRNRRGKFDVEKEYAAELDRILGEMELLSSGTTHDKSRPFFTRDQIRGRIQFVITVNPGRARRLLSRFRQIKWELVAAAAREQRLVISKKQITLRDEKAIPVLA